MRIVLVAPNAHPLMGGEAMKVIEYFRHLLRNGSDVVLVTHVRNRDYVMANFPPDRVTYVADGPLQRMIARSPFRKVLMDPVFHWFARALIRAHDPGDVIVHYLCPISPVQPRLPPRGYRFVVGPLNGNVAYPPAFRDRVPFGALLRTRLYLVVQRIVGYLLSDKRRARRILIAGGDRTRLAVRWAGAVDEQMAEVLDSGVSDRLAALTPLRHAGPNRRIMAAGRLEAYKGFDLAIAAVARAGPGYTLSIHGDGPMRASLEALVARLGVADRVTFHGWTPHDRLIEAMRHHRALPFPTLAEANGIIMQEAMMVGLPVIALNWGGPAILGMDGAAVLIEPTDAAAVVEAMAAAVRRIAEDGDHADAIAVRARRRAETSFRWRDVADSWSVAYDAPPRARLDSSGGPV